MSLTRSLMIRLEDVLAIAWRELRSILGDSGAILFFLVVPFAYPFLYAALYGAEVAREAPLVVVDRSRSELSREFVRRIDASPDVAVVARATTETEATPYLDRGEAYGVLVIPEDFSRRLMQGRQATVNLHSTFAAALYYKGYSLTTTEVALQLGRELEAERNPAASTEATRIQVRPIESEWTSSFNPQGGFQGFLLPGVLVLILQQTLLLGCSMLMGTQRERGTLARPRLHVGGHYLGVLRLMLGRALCYLGLYTMSSLFVLVLAPRLFGLPQLLDLGTYCWLLPPMLLAMIFFALFWALVVQHREKTMILWVFTSIPFLFLTGLSWPLSAIPAPLRALGYLIPSTPGVQAYVAASSMGAQPYDILPQYTTLWVQAIVYFLLATYAYARMLRKAQSH